jgi:hypothetical protein
MHQFSLDHPMSHDNVQHVLQADNSKSTDLSVIHSRREFRGQNLSRNGLTQRYARYWICDMSVMLRPQWRIRLKMIHKIAGRTKAATNVITSATTKMTVAATRFNLKADSI